jgi:hypothetical protein
MIAVTFRLLVALVSPHAVPVSPLTPVSVEAEKLVCVGYHESRDHLIDTNVSSGAEGLFQFMPYEWQYARAQLGGLPATPNQATYAQQYEVADFYYQRNGGLYPEWQDGC